MARSAELPPRETSGGFQALRARVLTRRVQYALDLLVLVAAFMLAYNLRFEFQVEGRYLFNASVQLPFVVLLQFVALAFFGVYSFVWRYIGMSEVQAFVKAVFWSGLVMVLMRLSMPAALQHWRVPLSIILMDSVLAFGGTLGLRVVRRAAYERDETRKRSRAGARTRRKPVLLVGAGRAGVMVIKEIQSRGDMDVWVEGFVDDDPAKQGAVIYGRKVLGTTRDLARLCAEMKIDHVIITIAQASRRDIRRIVDVCESIPVKARIIPGFYEIIGGTVEVSRIRDVGIEDLLGREPVQLDEAQVAAFLAGKSVMVTGAGGSIGSELARQAARFAPARLLLVERAEFALFDVDRELRAAWPELPIIPLVADVGDAVRMRSIFAEHEPQVVLHAAAHKHVPMMETNPTEAVKNNVLGTRELGIAAGEAGAAAFVLVSTDKAVRPTSVMGATKRVAELVVQDLDRRFPTRFVAVRFGNVMGSAGSVVPIFREQIRAGGPVTVTDPEMVRYFMTIPEASQLVLQAGALAEGGEIFVLDMGEPVRILEMAKDMIVLSGLRPYEDVDIVFTGLRPGEKLFEELEMDGEQMERTRHPKIFIGRIAGYPPAAVAAALERLAELSQDGEPPALRAYFNQLLPEARLRQG